MEKEPKLIQLDIACGKRKKSGFTGVDLWHGADVIVDLEKFPWPFADESVDEIYCSHYIEHTPDLVSFANELYRIMKVGATAEIIAPYYSSIRAWQDPTHLRAISENTFLYFNKKWRLINKLDHYPIFADFDYECQFILDDNWKDIKGDELRFAMKHNINVISDIQAVITKRIKCDDAKELLLQGSSDMWNIGRFEQAVEVCNMLMERGEEVFDVYMMLAEYEYMKGDFLKSIGLFKKALTKDNEAIEAHSGLVRALSASGQTVAAQNHVNSIRKYDNELADLVLNVMKLTT